MGTTLLQIYQVSYYPVLTIGIIVFTSVFSFWAFNREDRLNKYSFMPYQVKHYKEGYRFLSSAFIHADELHLILNMVGLYFFGATVEAHFAISEKFGFIGGEAIFLLLYSSSIYASIIPLQLRLKDDKYYSALGASGAVSAVVFAKILIEPNQQMGLLFIPVKIPSWIFGIIFLGVSYYLARRKSSNAMTSRVGHEAHFWGAFYGILFMAIFDPKSLVNFYEQTIGRLF